MLGIETQKLRFEICLMLYFTYYCIHTIFCTYIFHIALKIADRYIKIPLSLNVCSQEMCFIRIFDTTFAHNPYNDM